MGSGGGSGVGDLIGGAALGAPIGGVWNYIVGQVDKARKVPGTRRRLRSMMDNADPLMEQIIRNNEALDRPPEEIQGLTTNIEESKKLVKKKIPWYRFDTFPRHQDNLQEKVDSLPRAFTMNLVPQIARDAQEILLMKKKDGTQMKGLCGPPPKRTFTVGLGCHLNNLKTKLLKENVPVLVLTGLGGSGKTTLAIEFCWDDEIRGYFKENIFFLTFTKTPKLKLIIETLFDHCGYEIREFQSDEEAVNKLGILLAKVVEGPKLLVLDDVWDGSERLVEKLKDQLSDGKILITSRIAYKRFGTPYHLQPLCDEDSLKLFRHLAQLSKTSSYIPKEDLVREVVRGCKGLPYALEIISGSLCQQPFEVWQKRKELLQRHSILQSHTHFRAFLQQFLDDVLEDKPIIKGCFMDLGLFPEDQRIPVAALIDMWAELHEPDENGINAVNNISELVTKNLANIVVTRNVASDSDEYRYYNNHFVKLHDHPRDLAIYLSNQEVFEQRKRLIIHINGENRSECWVDEKQQGMISRILSLIPRWLMELKQQQVAAHTLSISTDETFTSDWCSLQPNVAEVLILNLRTDKYNFPEFLKKMRKLKVLIVTNYGFHHSELNKFELLGSLSELKRIRLEKVSVPSLCKMKNLQKLSLYMCNMNQAFHSCTIQISEALPNLVEMSIDYCNDLVELPSEFCDIKPLKKLNITNCHKFSALPQDIGKLENLEVLRLSSCTDLEEMPASITRLLKLTFLDISDCIKLSKLPDNIGDLRNLRKICMSMGAYSRLREIPNSALDLVELKHVVCDKETAALWDDLYPHNVKIEVPTVDNNLNWLYGGSS